MEKLSYIDSPARAADGKREALTWLARTLTWERRLGELRPDATPEQKAA